LEDTNAEKRRATEAMQNLWNSDAQEAIRKAFRGLDSIQQKEILLSFVCQYEKESNNSWNEMESRTNALRILREVWNTKATSCSSYGQEYQKQCMEQYQNTLRILPCKVSSRRTKGGRVAMNVANRVDRIKCLGNAVVPQVAQVFARAIKKIEENK
jgi:hypothetical protein